LVCHLIPLTPQVVAEHYLETTSAASRILPAFAPSTGTWTTLADGFDMEGEPIETTDPEGSKVKEIEIKIDGVTRTVYSTDRNIRA